MFAAVLSAVWMGISPCANSCVPSTSYRFISAMRRPPGLRSRLMLAITHTTRYSSRRELSDLPSRILTLYTFAVRALPTFRVGCGVAIIRQRYLEQRFVRQFAADYGRATRLEPDPHLRLKQHRRRNGKT